MSDFAIDISNLSRNYGKIQALNNISLQVNAGEIFGYLGANGAGKTTTIKVMTGLLTPAGGDVRICGQSVRSEALWCKANIGYVPESGAVFEKLSPREFLTAVGHLYRLPEGTIAEGIRKWTDFFQIADRVDQRMDSFSKGMKQKVCWSGALLHSPRVLVLDEPLNGLDIEAISGIKELMKQFAKEGRTVFYSSHMVDVVEKLCTRLAVLHKGRILYTGTVEELRATTLTSSLEQALVTLWSRDSAHTPPPLPQREVAGI